MAVKRFLRTHITKISSMTIREFPIVERQMILKSQLLIFHIAECLVKTIEPTNPILFIRYRWE